MWGWDFLTQNDSGWYTGEVKYYNDHLQKYSIKFDDESKDCIGDDDIDMVSVCVCVCYLVDAIGFICGVLKLTFCSKMVNILWLVLTHAIGFTSFENFFSILKILILQFVCLKTIRVFCVSHFYLSFTFIRGMAWSQLTKVMPINLSIKAV